MTIGSQIAASNYNTIQAKVQKILGVGEGTYGYGQVVQSAPVVSGEIITEQQWLDLYYDVNNVKLHQLGAVPSIEMPSTTKSVKYRTDSPYFGLDTAITESDNTRFAIAGSRSSISAKASASTTDAWIKTASATLTVTFADANQARHFFNSGSKIRIRTSRIGGSDTYQNMAWSDILNNAGTRSLQAISLIPNVIGFYSLTDQWQTVYISTGSSIYSSLYTMNYYAISAKCNVADNSSGGATVIDFKIDLADLHQFNNAGTGIFKIPTVSPLYKDKVNGTLSIHIEELKDVSFIQPSGTWDTISPTYELSSIILDGNIPIGCQPFQIDVFPWMELFPIDYLPGEGQYNDPLADGVSLNLNLGGYYKSWQGTGIPYDQYGVYVNLIPYPWWEISNSATSIYTQRFDTAGNRIGAIRRYDARTYTGQDVPDDLDPDTVSVGSDGNYVLVWNDVLDLKVHVQLFNYQGTEIGTRVAFNNAQYPKVIEIGFDGEYLVLWEENLDGNPFIKASRFSSAGVPVGSTISMPSTSQVGQFSPNCIALGTTGEFVVSWRGLYGTPSSYVNSLFIQKFTADGVLTGPLTRITDTSYGSFSWDILYLGDSGKFVIAYNTIESGFVVKRYNSTGTFDINLMTLGGYGSSFSIDAELINSTGEFLISWDDKISETDYSIYVQKFNSDGSLNGTRLKIESQIGDTRNDDVLSDLAVLDENGRYAIVWREDEWSSSRPFVNLQIVDSSNTFVGMTKRLYGDADSAEATSPTICAVGPNGAFVAAWKAMDNQGDNSFFAQKFDINGNELGLLQKLEAIGNPVGEEGKSHDKLIVITPIGEYGEYIVTWDGESQPYTLWVDGGYVRNDGVVDLTTGFGGYRINNPIVLDRYSKVGGSDDGIQLPDPGHTIYQGVATTAIDFYTTRPRDYGMPIVYEQWYSLNMDRTDPLRGYNNYSFLGGANVASLTVDVWNNYAIPPTYDNGYVKYCADGYFKSTANMYSLQPSDFIAGAEYFYDEITDLKTIRVILNGQIIKTSTTPGAATSVYLEIYPESSVSHNYSEYQTKTSAIYSLYADATTPTATDSVRHIFGFTEGLIDTYQIKRGTHVYNKLSGGPGRYSEKSLIELESNEFYTLPNTPLLCAPATVQPEYVPPAPLYPDYWVNFLHSSIEAADPEHKATDIASDSENNIYVVGNIWTIEGPGSYLVKYNQKGVIQWQKEIRGTDSRQESPVVSVDVANNVYVAVRHGTEVSVIKYSPAGTEVWKKQLGFNVLTGVNGSTVDSSNNLILAGRWYNESARSTGLLAKYTSSGNLSWQKIASLAGNDVYFNAVDTDLSGNIYAVGNTNLTTPMLFKFNSSGSVAWQKNISIPAIVHYSIAVDASGNSYVLLSGNSSAHILKYNTAGVQQWSRSVNFAGTYRHLRKIIIDSTGNIYCTGSSVTGFNEYYICVIKFDSTGNVLWGNRIYRPITGGYLFELLGQTITTDQNNDIIIGGYSLATIETVTEKESIVIRIPQSGDITGIYDQGIMIESIVVTTSVYAAGDSTSTAIISNASLTSQNSLDRTIDRTFVLDRVDLISY